jgi:uncharacterized protein (TIRG00374 family)
VSEDSDVLHEHDGGNVQVKDRDDGSAETSKSHGDGSLSVLRSALADSSLPQILLAFGVVVAVVIIGVNSRGEVLRGIRALAHANVGWLLLALFISVMLLVVGTITQFGSMPVNPPVRRVFAVQVAANFANHLLPAGTGGMVVNVRFLHRHGLGRGAAVGSVGLNSLAGLVSHVVMLVAAIVVSPTMMSSVRSQFDWSSWGDDFASIPAGVWVGLGIAAAILACAALIGARSARGTRPGVWVERQVRRAVRMARRAVKEIRNLGAVIRQPSRATALWLGSLSVPLIHALVIFTVLKSISKSPVHLSTVVVIYVVVSSLSALVPSPGGVGALDVALPLAFSTIGSISLTDAVAAVVGYRLLTVWLPLLPSATVFAFLLRRRII